MQPGIEAKVNSARAQDFKFVNQTEFPFIISAALRDGKLVVELYSFKSKYEITYYVTDKEHVKPRTIYRLSAELPIGQEKVLEKGKDGLRLQVYRKISEVDSSFEEDNLISRDFYPPKNKVVLVSSKSRRKRQQMRSQQILLTMMKKNPSKESENKDEKSDTDDEKDKDSKSTDKNDADESKVYDKGGNLITSDEK